MMQSRLCDTYIIEFTGITDDQQCTIQTKRCIIDHFITIESIVGFINTNSFFILCNILIAHHINIAVLFTQYSCHESCTTSRT